MRHSANGQDAQTGLPDMAISRERPHSATSIWISATCADMFEG